MFDEGWDWGGHAALSLAIPANAATINVNEACGQQMERDQGGES